MCLFLVIDFKQQFYKFFQKERWQKRFHDCWDHSFETTFIWDLFIWDFFIWVHIRFRPRHLRKLHLRPHSFQTTVIWDHIHLRPLHLRLHWFEITFILRHVKVKLFWFTVHHFLWSAFHFFAGDLKFCKLTIHLKFCKVAPFRVQGWLTLVCKRTRTQSRIKGAAG